MSDQSPLPKPKLGSLRDRIAAFENKGGTPPGAPPGPPPPRPKPSGLQWKPKPPSPPTSPDRPQPGERKPPSTGGMSASDAMESIGRGGSLKERMAALQGKGAFGGAPPPVAPKPNVERPKWKPPPVIPAPVSSEDESKEGITRVDASGREASRSPPPRAVPSPTPENQEASNREGDVVVQEGDGGNLDPEEDERQRRAAIAARMARLGGARFGMAPPIFAPKPVVRKSEPAPEVKEETPTDQPTVLKESNEGAISHDALSTIADNSMLLALVPSPRDLPTAPSPVPETVVDTERKDEPESSPPVPTRAPTSMPVPAGPRRAAPPRKKASKNAPATALPQLPVEEADGVAVQSPPMTDQIADRAVQDVSLTTRDSQEIGEVAEAVEATRDEYLSVTADVGQRLTSPPASTEAFHEPVEEHEKQEAEEELIEGAGSHVEEESMHTAADDQEASSEQPPEPVEEEADEEARRQRVAAKLAHMGAFDPLSGPLRIPQRPAHGEPVLAPSEEPLDVEDEVNVDTEEYGETVPHPLAVRTRHDSVKSIKHDVAEPHLETDQDDTKVDADDQVPAHRDGEHAVALYTEEQGDGHDGHTLPSPEHSEDQPNEYDSVHAVAQQGQGIASARETDAFEASGTTPLEAEVQECRLRGDTDDLLARSTTAEIEHDTSKDGAEEEEMPPPRITRPIPPPPVNFQSKPTPPSSPPLSPPPKTPLQTLRADEEERPASPDMPPRPVPPPGRSGTMMEDAPSPPPRRSIPPPPRRTSVRVTDPMAETPSSPPPIPTSSRPINRRPVSPPPIITTLAVQEQVASEEHESVEHVAEEENTTPQPEAEEDEASVRRRAIAERMARLGGIRFGAPPPMNPLSRPPLPAAPPPTSIPPDETESEAMEEEGPREEEEEDEFARKQRIAAKLAGMGGMRLGMLPPAAGLPPPSARRLVSRQEDSENEDTVPPVPIPAPPQRPPPTRKPPPPIAMSVEQVSEQAGGESRGTSDDGVQVEAEESEMEEVRYSDAEVPLASEEEDVRALPPPRRSTQTPRSAEALPTPPPRMTSRSPPPGRPPIPMITAALLRRRPSTTTGSASSSRKTSLDETSPGETPTISGRVSESAVRSHSEYVMVEAEDPNEDNAPAPPSRRRSTRGPVRSIPLPPPPPPSAIDPPEMLTNSARWELPSIPQGVEFGEASEMTLSGWSEDSTVVHVPPPVLSAHPGSRSTSGKVGLPTSSTSVSVAGSGTGSVFGSSSASGRKSLDQQQQQLTTDELMAIWGKVGVQVVEAATTLFEKSKRALVGDGSYAGFVRAVLAQVPGVVVHPAGSGDDDWGYVVYAQTGNAVQRRVSEILPGDVIAFWDAKLKGHKGLHAYTQTAGAGGGPLVGIVSEFDAKKSKVRVWQANQHVGQQVSLSVFRRLARVKNGVLTPRATQTVENVSYRLEDLKSGQVKVSTTVVVRGKVRWD
ncbi:hypothetical protein J3R83DRAFT_5576 [Lanmaoa asiatica]|nr:hypothetical protein J3R83DRAFT_5576 [Lanmaoa asiatica]